MHYKFKLTSILALNVYDCCTRGGGGVSVDTKGGGGFPLPLWGLFGFWGTKTRFLVGYKV